VYPFKLTEPPALGSQLSGDGLPYEFDGGVELYPLKSATFAMALSLHELAENVLPYAASGSDGPTIDGS
jgi:two-component sensor histidine kinase